VNVLKRANEFINIFNKETEVEGEEKWRRRWQGQGGRYVQWYDNLATS